MIKEMKTTLKPIQTSLLMLFNKPMKEAEVLSLKRVLVKHYDEILQDELANLENTKSITQKEIDGFLNAKS